MERKLLKKEIRKLVKDQRKLLTEEQIAQKSRSICEAIIGLKAFQDADTIYTYIDCKGEVSTKLLNEIAWACGKRWLPQE